VVGTKVGSNFFVRLRIPPANTDVIGINSISGFDFIAPPVSDANFTGVVSNINLIQVTNGLIYGGGYSNYPVGNYIITLSNYSSGGTSTGNKVSFGTATSGDILISSGLSVGTADEITNIFAQVKVIDSSNWRWYIYGVGKGGKMVRMISTDTNISGTGNTNTPGISALANLTTITHGLTTEDLKRIWFVDEAIGYAFGNNYTVLKTTDSGFTWSKLTLPRLEKTYGKTVYDGMVVGSNLYLKMRNAVTSNFDVLKYPL
jgi:hypothetical protein